MGSKSQEAIRDLCSKAAADAGRYDLMVPHATSVFSHGGSGALGEFLS